MEQRSTLVRRGYGATTRIAFTEILVLGLISFWVFTVYKLWRVIQGHFKDRWLELGSNQNFSLNPTEQRAEGLGFVSSSRLPILAMILYGLSGILVVSVFFIWSVIGEIQDYATTMSEMLVASTLFYVATLITMLWAAKTLQRHELGELLLREQGEGGESLEDLLPSDEQTLRWEGIYHHVSLFLVLALPMVYSPAYGAHLFLTGQSAQYQPVPAIACFVFAAIYHLWGTALLANMLNSHLAFERAQTLPAEENDKLASLQTAIPTTEKKQTVDVSVAPKRTLAAIMLTDMVGYSKDMERDEQGTYQRLLVHNEIVRASIANHQGREIKTIGDAFLALFTSAMSAVDCAISIQEAFFDFNANRPASEQILIRIGVHLGDVLITEDDIYGDGVNVAARIEPLADPGGICVSEEVYSLVRKRIELKVEQLDNPSLKNISVAPRIYKVHFR